MMEYTKGGFDAAVKTFNPADLNVDLAKKSIMVTGANSGIGKTTALEVAKRNATVHMVCRSKERGEAAQKEIIEQSKNQVVIFFFLGN
jgi:dehydrogenase/reductase SDR family protein 12